MSYCVFLSICATSFLSIQFRLPLPPDPVLAIQESTTHTTISTKSVADNANNAALLSTQDSYNTNNTNNTTTSTTTDPVDELFKSPVKSIIISGVGAAGVMSPLLTNPSSAGNSENASHSMQPMRVDSTVSVDTSNTNVPTSAPSSTTTIKRKRNAPHMDLTQHQLSHYLSAGDHNSTTTSLTTTKSSAKDNDSAESNTHLLSQPNTSTCIPLTQVNSGKVRLLTQSTIPAHLLWENNCTNGTTSSNISSDKDSDSSSDDEHDTDTPPPISNVNTTTVTTTMHDTTTIHTLTDSELAEVELLLQGITAADMRWSQGESNNTNNNGSSRGVCSSTVGNDADGATSTTNSNVVVPATTTIITTATTTTTTTHTTTTTSATTHTSTTTTLTTKESTCELELDVHISAIQNQHHTRTAFGAELWAEEKARCEAKGELIVYLYCSVLQHICVACNILQHISSNNSYFAWFECISLAAPRTA